MAVTVSFDLGCPWPQKVKYLSRAEAKTALRRMTGRGQRGAPMNAYPCGAHWHLGHCSAERRAALREARSA